MTPIRDACPLIAPKRILEHMSSSRREQALSAALGGIHSNDHLDAADGHRCRGGDGRIAGTHGPNPTAPTARTGSRAQRNRSTERRGHRPPPIFARSRCCRWRPTGHRTRRHPDPAHRRRCRGRARRVRCPAATIRSPPMGRALPRALRSSHTEQRFPPHRHRVRCGGRDAMLAVGINGESLPLEHRYPFRMVVPGLYGYVPGTNWVVSLEVTRFDQAKAFWTTPIGSRRSEWTGHDRRDRT